MEVTSQPVLYHKLQVREPGVESEEEEEVESPDLYYITPQNVPRNEVGGLPGAWARLLAGLLLLAVSCSLAVRQLSSRQDTAQSPVSVVPPASGHAHRPGVYHHGAIISPAATCSHLGQELLVAGGNVVDAGVGAALCLAVVHPHSTGLGATFWGLFYNSSSGNSTALKAGPVRALAPGLGLPEALPALYLLHKRFGRLSWLHLLMKPTVLAQKGFVVDAPLASALAAHGTKGLCPLLCHADGTPLGLGAHATNPNLAAVLRRAALASSPDLAGDALLSSLAKDLGLEKSLARPTPTLQPALQLPMPQGTLFTTPDPSAGPELLALLEATLSFKIPNSEPCSSSLQPAVSSILATVDSNGSMLLLASSLNSSFGSGHLSPSTGVLINNLAASSVPSTWVCPLILRGGLDDTEADTLGLVASGTPRMATTMTRALLSHLARPQIQDQHLSQHQDGRRPTENPDACDQGTLLQVAAHAEHAHVSSVPRDCCPFQGF